MGPVLDVLPALVVKAVAVVPAVEAVSVVGGAVLGVDGLPPHIGPGDVGMASLCPLACCLELRATQTSTQDPTFIQAPSAPAEPVCVRSVCGVCAVCALW